MPPIDMPWKVVANTYPEDDAFVIKSEDLWVVAWTDNGDVAQHIVDLHNKEVERLVEWEEAI